MGWSLSKVPHTQEVLVPHANAPLTELGRLHLARYVVDDGWPLRRAADRSPVADIPDGGVREAAAGRRPRRPDHRARLTFASATRP